MGLNMPNLECVYVGWEIDERYGDTRGKGRERKVIVENGVGE